MAWTTLIGDHSITITNTSVKPPSHLVGLKFPLTHKLASHRMFRSTRHVDPPPVGGLHLSFSSQNVLFIAFRMGNPTIHGNEQTSSLFLSLVVSSPKPVQTYIVQIMKRRLQYFNDNGIFKSIFSMQIEWSSNSIAQLYFQPCLKGKSNIRKEKKLHRRCPQIVCIKINKAVVAFLLSERKAPK